MPKITESTRDLIQNEIGIDLYYFYHNWKASQKNKIHKGKCGDCNFGFGKHSNQIRGFNGVWIGGFQTIELLRDYLAKNTLRKIPQNVLECEKCIK